MKWRTLSLSMLIAALILTPAFPANAGFGDLLKKVQQTVGVSGELSENKIIQGLKEALEIGTKNTVGMVSKTDGYYKNPKISIPLPGAVQKVEKILQTVGYGEQVDAFKLSMNRAAEKAAPQAKSIFWDAIKQMSFDDARKILNGRDNEATLYFKEKTEEPLGGLFKPVIRSSMSTVGVTRYYQALSDKVSSIPFAGNLNMDLNQYVTDRALSGLFLMLAEEERKIRKDPAARVTDLLKDVFGK